MNKSILFVLFLGLTTFSFADTIDVDDTLLTPLSSYSEASDSDTNTDANTNSQNEEENQESNNNNEATNQDDNSGEQYNESDE